MTSVRWNGRLLLALLLAACAEADTTLEGVTVAVEGGVTVVTNPGLHVADTLAWRLDTAAMVRIGAVDGPEEYLIGRLAGMLRRHDGTILIADAIAHELRIFDDSGRFLWKTGRRGEGPGEFDWIMHVIRYAGDSIAVLDYEGGRVTILDPDLGFVRRFHPRLAETRARYPMSSHELRDFFGDGTALITDYLGGCNRREPGLCEDSVSYYRTDGTGPATAAYGPFAYTRSEMFRSSGPMLSLSQHHPQTFWATHGDRFYHADGRRFEYRVHDAAGRLERVVRVTVPPPDWTRDELLPTPARQRPVNAQEEAMHRRFDEARGVAQLPDSVPLIAGLHVDPDGNVWLREYVAAGRVRAHGQPRWFVFDPDGRLRYSLRSPLVGTASPIRGIFPEIGRDHVLGELRDEYGVEAVVYYPLRKRPQ